jgi:rubrerythrin
MSQELPPDASPVEAIQWALHHEVDAERVYTALAHKMENPATRKMFLELAAEEAKHKLLLQAELDRYLFQEN